MVIAVYGATEEIRMMLVTLDAPRPRVSVDRTAPFLSSATWVAAMPDFAVLGPSLSF